MKNADKLAKEFKKKNLTFTYNNKTKFVLKNGAEALGDIKAGTRLNVKEVIEGDNWISGRIAVLGQKKVKINSDVKSSAKVEINENGFSPAILTIKKGGTVTWENKFLPLAWPASDPHPAHINASHTGTIKVIE